MKYWILRRLYEFTYWFGDKVAPPESNINYGYYTKYPKPETVKDENLVTELKRLGNAINEAN